MAKKYKKKQNVKKTTRLIWPDAIRVISVFLVILIHVSVDTVLSWGKVSSFDWMVANIFDSLSRISVPLFVMLSGSLLLHKRDNLQSFFKKRMKRILMPWLFWGAALLIFNHYFGFSEIGSKDIKLLIVENFFGGFWFMPMLVGVYMVAPIIKKFAVGATTIELNYFFSTWFLIASFLPTLDNIISFGFSPTLPVWISYLGYFVGGYFIVHRLKVTERIIKNSQSLFIINFFATIAGTYLLSFKQNSFSGEMYEFLSVNTLLMSFSSFIILFNFFKNYKFKKDLRNIINQVNNNSFGILLSHIIILRLYKQVFPNYLLDINPVLSIPLLTIFILFLTNELVSNLKKLPVLKTIVG